MITKFNCHNTSRHGNYHNRPNVSIETRKVKHTRQIKHLMISINLQEVSLEYDILQWNKLKQIICILKKNNCLIKILEITSIV